MEDLTPDTLLNNRYRIIRPLGRGGMGAVYLAHDNSLDQEVAVKVNFNSAKDATDQFLREARLLAGLRHPNLPRVIDYFVISDSQYLVMDYIPGDDLGSLLEREGAQPLDKVMPWAQQIGSAISYLHSQNPPVIHRDIKPANIKLTSKGEAMLVDFGIAKATEVSQVTSTGAMAYTPGFAPPEQYGHARTGPYSDQYSLAATLYMLLTNQKPVDSMQRLLDQAVLTPMRLLMPSIPPQIQSAIEHAMATRPDGRYARVEDFMEALFTPPEADNQATVASPRAVAPPAVNTVPFQPALPPSDGSTVRMSTPPPPPASAISAPPPPIIPPVETPPVAAPQPSRAWIGIVVGVVLLFGILAVVVVGALLIINGNKNKPTPTTAIAAVATTEIPNPIIGTDTPEISITDTPEPSATPELPTDTPEPTITSTIEPSPTATQQAIGGGGWLAFSSDRADGTTLQIWLMRVYQNTTGGMVPGEMKQLTYDEGDKTQPAWSPDGSKLVYVAPGKDSKGNDLGSDLWMINADGTEPTHLLGRKGQQTDPIWSWDGKWIGFTDNSREDGVLQVYILSVETNELRRISFDLEEYHPAWSPDMTWLSYVVTLKGGNAVFYRRTSENDYATPEPFDIVELLGRLGQVAQPSWSPDGAWVVYTQLNNNGQRKDVAVVEVKSRGGNVAVLTDTHVDYSPAWSSDSTYIAFTSERDKNSEIYLMLSAGQFQTNLSNSPGKDQDPAWQPLP